LSVLLQTTCTFCTYTFGKLIEDGPGTQDGPAQVSGQAGTGSPDKADVRLSAARPNPYTYHGRRNAGTDSDMNMLKHVGHSLSISGCI